MTGGRNLDRCRAAEISLCRLGCNFGGARERLSDTRSPTRGRHRQQQYWSRPAELAELSKPLDPSPSARSRWRNDVTGAMGPRPQRLVPSSETHAAQKQQGPRSSQVRRHHPQSATVHKSSEVSRSRDGLPIVQGHVADMSPSRRASWTADIRAHAMLCRARQMTGRGACTMHSAWTIVLPICID